MLTVKQACVPRSGTFDASRRDTVLDLTDLVQDRVGHWRDDAKAAGLVAGAVENDHV